MAAAIAVAMAALSWTNGGVRYRKSPTSGAFVRPVASGALGAGIGTLAWRTERADRDPRRVPVRQYTPLIYRSDRTYSGYEEAAGERGWRDVDSCVDHAAVRRARKAFLTQVVREPMVPAHGFIHRSG